MIIGTAGHIDHGKSALVTALTGKTVDRLAEEQRRGITIDLNFAPLELEGLPPAGFVDVPGHEDFVRTMVAGASGVDLVLLVVDLAEGPRPQTLEHLAILEQLRVPHGIPVFTKADLVEPDWADLVVADFQERLATSAVRWGPPAVVSAHSGQGIAELRERLRGLIGAQPAPGPRDDFRLPIDRVFSSAGVGTVVTGTCWSGRAAVGGTVWIQPGGMEARIRSIEAYGRPRDHAAAGTRTALGLAGVERSAVRRGQWVVSGDWRCSTVLDVALELLVGAAPLRQRARVRVHAGTAEVLARVYGRGALEAGGVGPARLVLEAPLLARGGDRFVLRSYSPVETIGGGRVLDALPPRRAPWPNGLDGGEQRAWAAALVGRRPFGIAEAETSQLLGPGAPKLLAQAGLVAVGQRWMAQPLLDALASRAVERIKAQHRTAPGEWGLSLETLRQSLKAPADVVERVLADLRARGAVKSHTGLVALNGFTPTMTGGEESMNRLMEVLDRAGLETPTAAELAAALDVPSAIPLLKRALDQGQVLAVDRERWASRAALERLKDALAEVGAAGDITPAALRDRLGLSRKFLIPLLEWSDRQGVTRRVGDVRVLVQSGR